MRDIVEAVERRLAGDLPVGLAGFPAILAPADQLADDFVLGEAVAGIGGAVGEAGPDDLREWLVGVAVEGDEFEPAAEQSEFVIAGDLVIEAALALAQKPDLVGVDTRSRRLVSS